jgi:fatty-acyl-CoA synthase
MSSVLAVPTTCAALCADTNAISTGHAIRTFSTGGGAMPRDLARVFEERFGIVLKELWGMTEFQGILSANPHGAERPRIGSVGLLNPFHRVKPLRLDGGRYVGEGSVGEKGTLAVAGPCMTPGYLRESPDGSLRVQGMPGEEAWLNTGDLGTVDADGFIWLFGREKGRHHPRRPQSRPWNRRGRAQSASGGASGVGRRRALCSQRRAAAGVRPIETWSAGRRG